MCVFIQSLAIAIVNFHQTSTIFNQFLQENSEHPTAVDILHLLRVRYFSPTELLRLFGFEPFGDPAASTCFIWPPNINRKMKYRLIGNSVNVEAVVHLILFLYE